MQSLLLWSGHASPATWRMERSFHVSRSGAPRAAAAATRGAITPLVRERARRTAKRAVLAVSGVTDGYISALRLLF